MGIATHVIRVVGGRVDIHPCFAVICDDDTRCIIADCVVASRLLEPGRLVTSGVHHL